jgi:Carboxypeptidase regulatory-like domain
MTILIPSFLLLTLLQLSACQVNSSFSPVEQSSQPSSGVAQTVQDQNPHSLQPTPLKRPLKQENSTMNSTGITGQVFLSPVHPVQRSGESNERPHQATISIINASNEVVTQVQTDAEGHFQVTLEPGTYTLRPESTGVRPLAKPQTVIVPGEGFISVQVRYDSGIR